MTKFFFPSNKFNAFQKITAVACFFFCFFFIEIKVGLEFYFFVYGFKFDLGEYNMYEEVDDLIKVFCVFKKWFIASIGFKAIFKISINFLFFIFFNIFVYIFCKIFFFFFLECFFFYYIFLIEERHLL